MLIVFVALVLGILMLTRQNTRLRAELKAARQQATSNTAWVVRVLNANQLINAHVVFTDQASASLSAELSSQTSEGFVQMAASDSMPNGPDAFARSTGDK
jgi:hypothetical protein